jgi:flagellar biosynthetic protein FliR
VVTVAQAWGFFQVFLRVVALFSVAPVFGSREIPAQIRIALALLLALSIYPLVSGSVAPPPTDLWGLVAAALSETLIGLLMGLVVSLLFQAVLVAGDLMDLQMGFGMAAVFNPSLGAQTAMMGQFLYRYALVVFLLLNGHHLLLGGIVTSFADLPAARLALGPGALRLAGDLALTVFSVGIRIAAPAVATLLIVDVALALVSRAVPQMNVFMVGMPLKVVVGLVIVVAALGLVTTVLQTYAAGIPAEMLHGLRALRGD